MCGRYVSASSPDDIASYFGATTVAESLDEPNFNVAPTTQVPVVVARNEERCLELHRWGLVPSWADDLRIGSRMINARVETVTTKNAFRAAIKRRRCIIPADAFYEWTTEPNPAGGKPLKLPWYIHRTDGDPFAFAGIYEVWRDRDGASAAAADTAGAADGVRRVLSCSVLTTAANAAMSKVHDRMPVMLAPHRWDSWLDPDDEDAPSLLAAIEPTPDRLISMYRVGTAVNNSRSRGEALTAAVDVEAEHAQRLAEAEAQGQLL